ncbi:MAG: hypothetical protein AB7N76_12675 [Planctomycetota bacterium]
MAKKSRRTRKSAKDHKRDAKAVLRELLEGPEEPAIKYLAKSSALQDWVLKEKAPPRPDVCNESVMGRLLKDVISWECKHVRYLRNGGLGREDVLTAEAIQALQFLPREHFLAAVVRRASMLSGASAATRDLLAREAEATEVSLLPNPAPVLRPSEATWQKRIGVVPDGLLNSPSVYAMVESKGYRSNASFQDQQLAREFVVAVREAKLKKQNPLLLLILPKEPPVTVDPGGRMEIRESIARRLPDVLELAEGIPFGEDGLRRMIDSTVCWLTWEDVALVTEAQVATYDNGCPSTLKSVQRVARSVIDAIRQHQLATA